MRIKYTLMVGIFLRNYGDSKMTNYAELTTRSAWLWTDFGSSYASKIVPQEILDELPRYVRGNKKGKIQDHKIVWSKVERGGWDDYRGRVERRVGKVILAQLVYSPYRRPARVVADFELDENNAWKRW